MDETHLQGSNPIAKNCATVCLPSGYLKKAQLLLRCLVTKSFILVLFYPSVSVFTNELISWMYHKDEPHTLLDILFLRK